MSKAVVIIVEDDPDVASFLDTTLRDEFETMVAGDGVAASRLLDQTVPDLVVLDVRLPCLSGPELCQMIRSSARLSRTPILVVTGFPESTEAGLMRDMGVDRILAKPVTARRLLATVREILSASPRARGG